MKINLWQAENGLWYFHFKARNGRIIAQSQGYKSKHGAKQTIIAIGQYFAGSDVQIVEVEHE